MQKTFAHFCKFTVICTKLLNRLSCILPVLLLPPRSKKAAAASSVKDVDFKLALSLLSCLCPSASTASAGKH